VTFPPLFERELRAGARRAGFFSLRTILEGVTVWLGYQWLNVESSLGMGRILLARVSGLLFFAALLMALLSADSISRERREGTLGLLLLTGLRPPQIIYGKLLSNGLMSFFALLACLPPLMISVLLGGVSGYQAATTGLGLLNILFVALAAALWVSARFRERVEVFPATVALLLALTVGPQILSGGSGVLAILSFFGGWSTWYGPIHSFGHFLIWFLWMQAVGWFFLRRAAAALEANWRDEPVGVRPQHGAVPPSGKRERSEDGGQRSESREQSAGVSDQWAGDKEQSLVTSVATISEVENQENEHLWGEGSRPWDADPIRWRMERIGLPHGPILIAVALAFFGHFISMGNGLAGGAAVWGCFLTLTANAVLAWAGARLFQDAHRLQDLELLLTTPMGGQNIVRGQWHILRRALLWPAVIALAVALPSAIAIINGLFLEHGGRIVYFLPSLLTPFNLVLEVIALCWVGMWFGLRSRSLISAVAWTVCIVQLAPVAATMLLLWAGFWVYGKLSPGPDEIPEAIPILLLFAIKNLALIFWARSRLRRELRVAR